MAQRVSSLLSCLIVIVVLGTAIAAQSQSESGPYRLRITVTDQPGSPIRLSAEAVFCKSVGLKCPIAPDDLYREQPQNILLKLENVSGELIIAYALISRGRGFENVQVNELVNPLWPGKYLYRGFGTGGREELEYSLDYVLFADGRSWGADKNRRSQQIAMYYDGRKAAIEKLRTLASPYPNANDFIAQASNFGGYLSSDAAGDPDPRVLAIQYRNAWIHIVNSLRNSVVRRTESSKLADALEAAIPAQ